MKPLAQNTLIQNRYLIVHLIGKGGMGEVYLAVDQRLGSAVALKRTYFAGDEMLGNAFEREARTLARMRHPVLPKVSDHFGEGEEQYLVMEHISGDDLSKRLESAQKPFPISWVLFWADQLLDALSYLHTHEPPIIHRDIKPQNLKLTDDNNIILLDFGLSKTSTGQTNISQSGSTGSVIGYTPHYAPMEQIRGIGTSARSDLYSLSATLYQLLSNTVPADALSRADTMLNGLPDPVIPIFQLNPEVSTNVSDVILKGMEVSQEKRFADAREMQRVLRRAFTEMQGAMSAKTVAFTGHSDGLGTDEISEITKVRDKGGIGSPRTLIEEKGPQMPGGAPGDVDFDATIAIDAKPELPRQSDVKTEVFLAGSDAFAMPDKPADIPAEPIPEAPAHYEDSADAEFAAPWLAESDTNGNVAASTMPVIALEEQPSSFTPPPPPTAGQPKAAPAKKSSGKTMLVLGGLFALFVLALAAAGGGWYVYSNYYAGTAIVEPTPSPEPTIEATPSPEPTLEAVTDANGSTSTNSSVFDDTNTNSANSSLEVPPTPTPETIQSNDVPTRSASTPFTSRTPVSRPAATPAVRATPKPKSTGDRTVILQ